MIFKQYYIPYLITMLTVCFWHMYVWRSPLFNGPKVILVSITLSQLILYIKVWGPKGIGHFTKMVAFRVQRGLDTSQKRYILSLTIVWRRYTFCMCNDFFKLQIVFWHGQNRSRFGIECFVLEKLIKYIVYS